MPPPSGRWRIVFANATSLHAMLPWLLADYTAIWLQQTNFGPMVVFFVLRTLFNAARLTYWVLHLLINISMYCFIELLIYWFIVLLIYPCILFIYLFLSYWFLGLPMYWFINSCKVHNRLRVLTSYFSKLLIYWFDNVLISIHWLINLSMYWFIELLVY